MTDTDDALWWARVRASGPLRIPPEAAYPAGMTRLVEPATEATAEHDGARSVWLVPDLPDNARPDVLEELGLPGQPVDQRGDTARVLAACLRCCWAEPSGPIWPGVTATLDDVAESFRTITDTRDDRARHAALLGAVRRLAGSGWLLLDEQRRTVRLGPRVATWNAAELSSLRELWRSMPR